MSDQYTDGWIQPSKIKIAASGEVYLDRTGYGVGTHPTRTADRTVLARPVEDSHRVDLFVPADQFRHLGWNQTPEKAVFNKYVHFARSLWVTDTNGMLTPRFTPGATPGDPCTVPVGQRLMTLSQRMKREGASSFVHYLGAEHLLLDEDGRLVLRDYWVDEQLSIPHEEQKNRPKHPVVLTYDQEIGMATLRLPFTALADVSLSPRDASVVVPSEVYTSS